MGTARPKSASKSLPSMKRKLSGLMSALWFCEQLVCGASLARSTERERCSLHHPVAVRQINGVCHLCAKHEGIMHTAKYCVGKKMTFAQAVPVFQHVFERLPEDYVRYQQLLTGPRQCLRHIIANDKTRTPLPGGISTNHSFITDDDESSTWSIATRRTGQIMLTPSLN